MVEEDAEQEVEQAAEEDRGVGERLILPGPNPHQMAVREDPPTDGTASKAQAIYKYQTREMIIGDTYVERTKNSMAMGLGAFFFLLIGVFPLVYVPAVNLDLAIFLISISVVGLLICALFSVLFVYHFNSYNIIFFEEGYHTGYTPMKNLIKWQCPYWSWDKVLDVQLLTTSVDVPISRLRGYGVEPKEMEVIMISHIDGSIIKVPADDDADQVMHVIKERMSGRRKKETDPEVHGDKEFEDFAPAPKKKKAGPKGYDQIYGESKRGTKVRRGKKKGFKEEEYL